MSTNLPETYARVVAMRPELAVNNSTYSKLLEFHFTKDIAALILARWVEMLPVGNGLYHAENYENGETRWWIGPNASMPTPLEALAAFWLQQ